MKGFVWLVDEAVPAVHDEQLAEHGGLPGIRDLGAVQAALARPRNLASNENCEHVARLATAYAYGIARNHGFSDGNKRTALVAADLFLMLNGFELSASPAENVLTISGVADGSISEDDLATWFHGNIKAAS